MIYFVFSATNEGVIGKNNHLPWNIPSDLKLFKELTINKTILMGRNTYLSIGKPLPKRYNIVLSKTLPLKKDKNFEIIHDYHKIINKYFNDLNEDIYIIGGAQIYKLFENYAYYILFSKIKYNYSGNIKIDLNFLKNFQIIKTVEFKDFTFYKYERRK